MHLCLASGSPRRRELLALIGLPFRVIPALIDEQRHLDEPSEDFARRLSREKAEAAARVVEPPALILAADTIVVDGDDVLGKPRDPAEAAVMLRRLRGRTHRVLTGITLLDPATRRMLTEVACSPVSMRPYRDEEIEAYVAAGDPFDKAGAYAIQHEGFQPVIGFDHCFANVMGLPLCHAARMLRRLGLQSPVDIPCACQQALGSNCPVWERILAGGE